MRTESRATRHVLDQAELAPVRTAVGARADGDRSDGLVTDLEPLAVEPAQAKGSAVAVLVPQDEHGTRLRDRLRAEDERDPVARRHPLDGRHVEGALAVAVAEANHHLLDGCCEGNLARHEAQRGDEVGLGDALNGPLELGPRRCDRFSLDWHAS